MAAGRTGRPLGGQLGMTARETFRSSRTRPDYLLNVMGVDLGQQLMTSGVGLEDAGSWVRTNILDRTQKPRLEEGKRVPGID